MLSIKQTQILLEVKLHDTLMQIFVVCESFVSFPFQLSNWNREASCLKRSSVMKCASDKGF